MLNIDFECHRRNHENSEDTRPGPILGSLDDHYYNIFNFSHKDIRLEDIAHSLKYKCRWSCFTKRFHPVASHLLHGLKIAECMPKHHLKNLDRREVEKYFLLHDIHEAYLPDLPTPLKNHIKGWMQLEERYDAEIYKFFKVEPPNTIMKSVIKNIDRWCLTLETMSVKDLTKGVDWPKVPQDIIDLKIFPEYIHTFNDIDYIAYNLKNALLARFDIEE